MQSYKTLLTLLTTPQLEGFALPLPGFPVTAESGDCALFKEEVMSIPSKVKSSGLRVLASGE